MAYVDRYKQVWIELPDGRKVPGRIPGTSGVVLKEHVLRDELARHLRGVTEAKLAYGRPDVMTATTVFEVEPRKSWRHGMRQVLAYSAQTGLAPALALFGAAHRDDVLAMYLTLRDGSPKVELWWYSHNAWQRVGSRQACRTMAAPA